MMAHDAGKTERRFLERVAAHLEGLPLTEEERRAATGRLLQSMFGRFLRERGGHADNRPSLDPHFATLFDDYRWRLDEGPAGPGELTPAVLGLVAERHQNPRLLGAHYTGADVTGYIVRETVLPLLLDAAAPQSPAWESLSRDPDRYLSPALRHGVDLPLPPDIAAGLDDVTRREGWNRLAASSFALPLETWREHVTRRRHCLDLRARLRGGAVHTVDDLVTLNLDLCRFTDDLLYRAAPDLLAAYWHGLETLTVLDPTCGAGAFLLAALGVLEPLYVACLDRMRTLANDGLPAFRLLLERASRFPNRRCFVRYAIITHNLYGVDLVPEAAEACRLRLLLALLATVNDGRDLKRLPAPSFHVRAGNALVGSATAPAPQAVPGGAFHWHAVFPAVMERGGFDVVLGNPPFVEYEDVRSLYAVRGFATQPCGDLSAYVAERALQLLRPRGRLGLILPISAFGSDAFRPLQCLVLHNLSPLWISCFANRPAQLFVGAQKRVTILFGCKQPSAEPAVYTTAYLRWRPEERRILFDVRLRYARRETPFAVLPAALEKLGTAQEVSVFARLLTGVEPLRRSVVPASPHIVYYTRKFGYFLAFLDFVPAIVERGNGRSKIPSELKTICLPSAASRDAAVAVLSSSTFFWFWNVLSDGRNLNRRDLLAFPFSPERVPVHLRDELAALGREYLTALRATSRTLLKGALRIETFDYWSCKPSLDAIDGVLARYYGFSAEERDGIVNYDIKYRRGREGDMARAQKKIQAPSPSKEPGRCQR
jgi:hypothetical protein